MTDVPKDNQYAFVTPSAPPNNQDDFRIPPDDAPPVTVVTHVLVQPDGKLKVKGTTTDNGPVSRVAVNGQAATATAPNYLEWEVVLDAMPMDRTLTAYAVDASGNSEVMKHVDRVR
jgi:hypothetical protein